MYFCEDAELLAWEPGVFSEAAFGHQAIIKAATGTATGTALVMDAAVLGDVAPGMAAQLTLADDSMTQLAEIVSLTDVTHCVVSALRGRSSEAAIAPLVAGSVKVTMTTFRPQIAAVGDSLLGLVGIVSDRDAEPSPAYANLRGFKAAAIFGTLAAIYRTLVANPAATNVTYSKKVFYEGLASAARETLAATVDRDGDGVPETCVQSGVRVLVRG